MESLALFSNIPDWLTLVIPIGAFIVVAVLLGRK